MNTTAILLRTFLLLAAFAPLRAADAAPGETPLFVTPETHLGLDDRIFPLGWSSGGKFAWICKQSNEAADECNWVLTIQDTGTNKIAETKKFELPDKPANGIRQFWTAHGKAVSLLLETHGVKRTSSAMEHLPLVTGKRRSFVFQPVIQTVAATLDNSEFGGTKSFQVFLPAEEKKELLIRRDYDRIVPMAVGLAGCFVSPDEKFAAVVVTAGWRGYEGAPHPRKVEALAGFKTGIE